jgi:hypothetical protein
MLPGQVPHPHLRDHRIVERRQRSPHPLEFRRDGEELVIIEGIQPPLSRTFFTSPIDLPNELSKSSTPATSTPQS